MSLIRCTGRLGIVLRFFTCFFVFFLVGALMRPPTLVRLTRPPKTRRPAPPPRQTPSLRRWQVDFPLDTFRGSLLDATLFILRDPPPLPAS